MIGQGWDSGSGNAGIFLGSGNIVETSGLGTITLNGTGGNDGCGSCSNEGFRMYGVSTVSAQNGSINITGTGGSGGNFRGIYIGHRQRP